LLIVAAMLAPVGVPLQRGGPEPTIRQVAFSGPIKRLEEARRSRTSSTWPCRFGPAKSQPYWVIQKIRSYGMESEEVVNRIMDYWQQYIGKKG
jgi:hypothetical protein